MSSEQPQSSLLAYPLPKQHEYQQLISTHQILHLTIHRNKNQHRRAKWWKWLSLLFRSLGKLISLFDHINDRDDGDLGGDEMYGENRGKKMEIITYELKACRYGKGGISVDNTRITDVKTKEKKARGWQDREDVRGGEHENASRKKMKERDGRIGWERRWNERTVHLRGIVLECYRCVFFFSDLLDRLFPCPDSYISALAYFNKWRGTASWSMCAKRNHYQCLFGPRSCSNMFLLCIFQKPRSHSSELFGILLYHLTLLCGIWI